MDELRKIIRYINYKYLIIEYNVFKKCGIYTETLNELYYYKILVKRIFNFENRY